MIKFLRKQPGALPRQRPAPEQNIIQNPELLRTLQQRLGLRQAHVAPTLNDGVQPVVIVEDIPGSAQTLQIRYGCHVTIGAGSNSDCVFTLFNPPNSGKLVRLRRFMTDMQVGDVLNMGLAAATTAPPSPAASKRGQRLAVGLLPADVAASPVQSQAQWLGHNNLTVLTSTDWEMIFNNGVGAFTASDHKPWTMDFDSLLLGPGSLWQAWQHNFTPQANGYAEWEELPL